MRDITLYLPELEDYDAFITTLDSHELTYIGNETRRLIMVPISPMLCTILLDLAQKDL